MIWPKGITSTVAYRAFGYSGGLNSEVSNVYPSKSNAAELTQGMGLCWAAAGIPLILASTTAEAKASKAAVHYRDYPNGMRMCHMCKFFISAGGRRSGMMGCPMMGGGMMGPGMMQEGACEVVEGRISPMGPL